MVTALKRFTIDRAPRVLTLCLKCFDFSGKKISKVCTQLEGNSLSLPGAGDFPKQDALSQAVQVELFVFPSGARKAPVQGKHMLCCDRAALAENSFLPPKALPAASGTRSVDEPQRCILTWLGPGLGRLFHVVCQDHL